MDLKKIVAMLISIIMMIGTPVFSEENTEVYARYAWDGGACINLNTAFIEGNRVDVTKEGINLTQLRGGGPNYIAINLSKSVFPNNGKSKSVAVTVRYYDECAGAYFTLDYTGPIGPRTAAEKVEMAGDHTFKEHTFYIDECYFRSDNAGGDMLIATWTSAYRGSNGPVYIQWVEVKESFPQMPVNISVSNGKLGNIFDIDDEKILTAEIKNLTDSSELDVSGTYEILSYDKKVTGSGIFPENVTLPKSSISHRIELGALECGGYYIRIKLEYRGEYKGEMIKGEFTSGDINFSVVNKHDPDEKLNPMMRTQIQFQNNGRLEDMSELYQMVADVGMSGVREYLMWDKNNSNAPYNPYLFEKAFNCTESLGMTGNMGVIMGHPSYGGVTYLPVTDEAVNALCDYSEWWVKQYGDKFEYFEVWNEPNVYGAFNINNATPQQYTELVKAVYKRVKAVNPEIKVVALSTATVHYSFIDPCIEAGILDYCDAVSCHPYDWDTNADKTGKDRIRNDVYRKRAAGLRKKLDDAGYPDIEITWTEMGVRSGAYWASETAQAAYLTQLMAIMQGDKVVDNIYQFMFVNPGLEDDLTTGESHWGLIYDGREKNGPYAAKLSYVAMAGYNKLLSDAEPVSNIIKDKTSAYCFRRNRDGKDVAVLWCDNSYDNIGLSLGTNEVEVYDMYSNKQGTLKSNDGTYSFTATFEPMYVVGNFNTFAEADPVITVDNARVFTVRNAATVFPVTDKLGRNLRVEAEARDGIKISENNGMANGIAGIRVTTNSDAVNENALKIKIYDDNDLVFVSKAHAVIEDKQSEYGTSIETVEFIPSEKLLRVTGKCNFADTVTIEVEKIGLPGDVVTATVKDGKFDKEFYTSVSGECTVYAGRAEASETHYYDSRNMMLGEHQVEKLSVVNSNGNVSISGMVDGAEDGDRLTVIVLPESVEKDSMNVFNLAYIGETVITDSKFSHSFTMPEKSGGKYKIYLSSANTEQIYGDIENGPGSRVVGVCEFSAEKKSQINISSYLNNSNSEDMRANIIVAQYNSSGRIVSVDIKNISVEAYTVLPKQYNISVDSAHGASYAKAFIFDCTNELMPLTPSVTVE